MAAKLTVDHIERPELPWRKPDQTLTECGLVASSFPTITRAEFFQRYEDLGRQRTAMTICMTCFNTAQSWGTWEQDPLHGIERAMKTEPRHYVMTGLRYAAIAERAAEPPPNSPLRLELRAIAILIEQHRDEFDKLVAGLGEVVNLDHARRQKKLIDKQVKKKPWDFG